MNVGWLVSESVSQSRIHNNINSLLVKPMLQITKEQFYSILAQKMNYRILP
jgi:hypothetical protein